jgi:class 3 adenylate cyclase
VERVWQWVWDRHGPRYSWAVFAVGNAVILPIWVTVAVVLMAMTDAGHYVLAVAVGLGFGVSALALIERPGGRVWRPVERWAAGERTDRAGALEATYSWGRISLVRSTLVYGIAGAGLGCTVGAIGGERGPDIAQYAIAGASITIAVQAIALHQFAEALLRPARIAIAGDSDVGDALPRSRPAFAAWSNLATLATAFAFSFAGSAFAVAFDLVGDGGAILTVVIAVGLTIGFAVPITVGTSFAPALRPIRDLAEGTERVASGDYSRRLPVVQDDDLGALAASFNRMQSGLAERERLRAAFGSYVDPALATRLLEQGDDVFAGERRDVSVMFVDIRDFTPFAEANPAEVTVAHLNALFDIVVPTVLEAGGHVNKYLGDGALAVFGAPIDLDRHADAAVASAVLIQQLVTDRFGGEIRIGIGVNSGTVIAGTIGGGGKLEFTLIGDTVNVAARVEQLTKTTGDGILLTQDTLDALQRPPAGLVDRGEHELKGKSAPIRVHAVP